MSLVVIGYHLINTAYGWWLPNDPRGSTSKYIASDIIAELGELHFGRKKSQPASRDIRHFYERAAEVLKFPLLTFDDAARDCIAEAVGHCIQGHRYTCYGFAILADHAHVLLRKHKHLAETMMENIRRATAGLLRERGLRTPDHPVWCEGGWKVFLDHPEDIRRTIAYIEKNPLKHHMPALRWAFVAPYDNWPLHVGHNRNSPYARALGRGS